MLSSRRLRSPPDLLTCRSQLVSLIQRLLRDLFWAGPRLCQTRSPTPRRSSPRGFKRAEPATLLPSVNRLEKVANSPSQGKELIANPDVLDHLRNKVPDFRHLPISVWEGIALERTLRSVLESQSFLTWSVMGILKSLHLKNLLPKDDPVLSRLQKSFSKASNNVASGMTSSAAFLTLKRRQLLLSHVVTSVSEAQKRNLLADPFFQTSSLFDASSLESARSAARDMSLFKPHLRPRPLPHKVDDRDHPLHLTAEVLLGSIRVHRRPSAHPPLSDSSLVRREMPASIRSLPEPLRSGGVF